MLLALRCAMLVPAAAMRRATAPVLVLDGQGLREEGGREIATWSAVARIERGVPALKPSGGVTLVLREAGPGVWASGMWWRLGRRVGIGGVLRRQELRALGDALPIGLAQRAADARSD